MPYAVFVFHHTQLLVGILLTVGLVAGLARAVVTLRTEAWRPWDRLGQTLLYAVAGGTVAMGLAAATVIAPAGIWGHRGALEAKYHVHLAALPANDHWRNVRVDGHLRRCTVRGPDYMTLVCIAIWRHNHYELPRP